VFALQANHHRIFHFLGIFSRISLWNVMQFAHTNLLKSKTSS